MRYVHFTWLGLLIAASSLADIATDGSVGPEQTLVGPDFVIPSSLGTQRGANLFHSFDRFSITNTQSATFTSDFTGVTNNVISRVTGGMPSAIDGVLASTIPGADLWLINPQGVVFGPDASLDVAGGLHVSTADYVGLQDGGRFGADLSDPASTLLTVADVSAFGFGATPASIDVNGTLLVEQNEAISIVGGDINISGRIDAPSGKINLVSTTSSGEVGIDAQATIDDASVDALQSLGNIDVANPLGDGPLIRANGDQPGSIYIRGDSFLLDGFVAVIGEDVAAPDTEIDIALRSSLRVGTRSSGGIVGASDGSAQGPALAVQAPEIEVAFGSFITSRALEAATGAGGDLTISTDDLLVEGEISAETDGAGDAGHLRIGGITDPAADRVRVTGFFANISADSGDIFTPASGRGGDIDISADQIHINASFGGIGSDTLTGTGGNVTLNVDELLLNQGAISTSLIIGGNGTAGSTTIRGVGSTDTMVVPSQVVEVIKTPGTFGLVRIVAESRSTGVGGDIDITANQLTLAGGGFISTVTDDGVGGTMTLNVDHLQIGDPNFPFSFFGVPSALNSLSNGTGDAGDIFIRGSASANGDPVPTTSIVLREPLNGGISASTLSSELDAGAGGTVDILADTVVIQDGSSISSSTQEGLAGNVVLNVNQLLVTGSASGIDSLTFGGAAAGEVVVRGIDSTADMETPAELIVVTNFAELGGSPVDGAGAGGTIRLRSRELQLTDFGTVSVNSFMSEGDGGDINLFADDINIVNGTIQAGTGFRGNGGNILIAGVDATRDAPTPADSVSVSDTSSIISSSTAIGPDAGAAGNLTLYTDNLLLTGSSVLATTIDGQGGNLEIHAGDATVSERSRLSTRTSGFGDGGRINLFVDDLRVDDAIIEADSTPDLRRVAGYLRAQPRDALLTTQLNPGEVAVVSADPSTLGAPSEPFLFVAAVGFTFANLIAATDLETATRGSPFDFGAPIVSGVSDGNTPIELLISGAPDVNFVGDHTESADLDINLQFRTSGVFDFGDAGEISINGREGGPASRILVENDGRIASESFGLTALAAPAPDTVPDLVFDVRAGAAGGITVLANDLIVRDSATISAATVDGVGGRIDLGVEHLRLASGASILASTTGAGEAGSVLVRGTNSPAAFVLVDDASITSSSSGDGAAGSVVIESQSLQLRNSAQVSVASAGNGSAGVVDVTAEQVNLNNSNISATVANSAGGSVNFAVTGQMTLSDSVIEASAQGLNAGDSGGNVTIGKPDSLALNNSRISANANAGAGGNVSITTETFVQSAASAVTATSQSNVDGQVNIDAVNQITGDVVEVALPDVSNPQPLRQRCTPNEIEDRSSFVVDGAAPGAVAIPYLKSLDEPVSEAPGTSGC